MKKNVNLGSNETPIFLNKQTGSYNPFMETE